MRWIKAGKPNPTEKGKYYVKCKVDGTPEKNLIEWDGKTWAEIPEYDCYEDLEILEWLDESIQNTPSTKDEEIWHPQDYSGRNAAQPTETPSAGKESDKWISWRTEHGWTMQPDASWIRNDDPETRKNTESLYALYESEKAKAAIKSPQTPTTGEAGEVPAAPKMSDELAALSDIAALEYGKDNGQNVCREEYDYDNSADLTDAHEAGQSWMYRKLQPEITQLLADKEALRLERNEIRQRWEDCQKELQMLKPLPIEDGLNKMMADLPEDIQHWVRFYEDKYSHVKTDQDSFRAGATALYWQIMETIDNPTRLSFVKFAYGCMNERNDLQKEMSPLRDQLAEVTNDRDIYKEWYERSQANIAALTEQLGSVQGERDELKGRPE